MLSPDQLLQVAQAYAEATGFALTSVGKRAANNDKVFVRLAGGHGVNIKTIAIATAWFADNWPKGARWPKGVPGRPKGRVVTQKSRLARPPCSNPPPQETAA